MALPPLFRFGLKMPFVASGILTENLQWGEAEEMVEFLAEPEALIPVGFGNFRFVFLCADNDKKCPHRASLESRQA